jgi:sugar phosphate isomerase/epimerase
MKYAFMSFSMPEASLDEFLAMARDTGYAGVEPRAGSGHGHGLEIETSPADREAARKKAADMGVAFACVATSCKFADPATSEENVAQALQYIDLAADLGAPVIRVFGGKLPEGLDRNQATELVAKALFSLADRAEQRNVAVCMETHDDWTDPNHVAAIMRKVNRPGIAVNWDIMHPVRTSGFSIEDSYAIVKPWIRHVHFHDGTKDRQLKPIGQGIVDHKAAVKLLMNDGYSGFLSGEWIKWEIPYTEHLPTEIQTMKRYESEA